MTLPSRVLPLTAVGRATTGAWFYIAGHTLPPATTA
jgi:hypothetical protein